jgi:hypothetical protein
VFRNGISPLHATQIISDKPGYNALCGLTDTEVREIAQSYLPPSYQRSELEKGVGQLKRWYNGYQFCRKKHEPRVDSLYNPQLVFNHLRGLANKEVGLAPLEGINAVHMSSVLAAIPDTGFELYLNMIASNIQTEVARQFGAAEVRQRCKDASITWTLLYFFGVLTHAEDGRHLKVPNVTMINVVRAIAASILTDSDTVSDHASFLKIPEQAIQSDAAYDGLMTENVRPLVKLLEVFFGKEPACVVKDCNEAALRMALTAFWSNPAGKCLPELSLRVDPRAPQGEGRSGFLDLFLPGSSSTPCIELKSIPLDALWRGQNEPEALHSDVPLEELRKELQQETEEQLLERKVSYYTDARNIAQELSLYVVERLKIPVGAIVDQEGSEIEIK